MKKSKIFLLAILVAGAAFVQSCGVFSCSEPITTELRAPAYPLITIDPYTSAWSATDKLFDSPVRHWTGKTHSLIGALRVDGQTYRFLGKESIPLKVLVPMAIDEPWEGKVTFEAPRAGWEKPNFPDAAWITAPGAFGSPGSTAMNTKWTDGSIWVRRTFATPVVTQGADLYLIFSHDDDCEIYLNGTELVKTGDRARSAITRKIDKSLLAVDGMNVLAARCENRRGFAYLDFGLYTDPDQTEVFTQTAVQERVGLSATSTLYDFTCGPVGLKLRFVSPLLPEDLDLLARPVNFVNYEVVSNDGAEHQVEIYFETTPEWAVNDVSQEVEVTRGEAGGVGFIKAGTTEQPVLHRKGDNVRIDWGYVYLAAQETETVTLASGDYFGTKSAFMQNGSVEPGDERMVAKMAKKMPAMAVVNKLGAVSSKPASGFVMIAYDDIESIQYFGKNLKAWWKKEGAVTITDALVVAANKHKSVMNQCATFDNKLWKETLKAGGQKYADLCVLAFRQSIAAHKLVKDSTGNILFLSKENFSNGSIGTVDVTYPSAPLFLRYNPELLKGMLNPIFYYSESGKWTKPFAAHDVGTYPMANGQTYRADMPVEESGNMLVITMAIAHQEGNAKYAEQHWEVLTTWADYLLENGLDPENQLCTDDFAGHFAHNANLSVKAIMGIASYGKLAEMLGKKEIAEKYTSQAKEMAGKWVEMANDGDHFRLTFDQPGTWSQKYNLVWDKLLGLGIFPPEVAQTEVAYYLTKQNDFGLPLDNRRTYTKSDWIVWTATLADDTATFSKFIDPLHRYVTETPDRVPMSDWYETTNAKHVGFQARSVVGGYFIKLLDK